MNERRYQEDEVREIFELAASESAQETRTPAAASGLTLAEIQSIGAEVGLAPEQIARAAAAYAAGPLRPKRKLLGLPIEVGHTMQLPRPLTDHEWERLVSELRATFNARGTISVHGGLREWRNGNLHAYIEPAEGGYRLRIRTVKGNAQGMMVAGAGAIVTSAAMLALLALEGTLAQDFFVPWAVGTAGIGAWISNYIRVPRWARERDRQMRYIAEWLQSILKTDT